MLRFYLPLIEPDRRISRIRLSDRIREPSTQRKRPLLRCASRPFHGSWSLMEVIDNMVTLLTFPTSRTASEVRPLPSTGVTRLQRYYGPVRLPPGPSLSLTGVSFVPQRTAREGLPCCPGFLLRRAVVITPAGPSAGIKDHSPVWMATAFPFMRGGSAPAKRIFEACSTFTRVTARTLAESLTRSFSARGFDLEVTRQAARTATGSNDQAAGWDSHPLKTSAFARRTARKHNSE